MNTDETYLNMLGTLLGAGEKREDRTGTGTYGIFGAQMGFNLRKEFPLLTTKKLHFHSILHELIWLMSGDTNVKYLQDNGVWIWDEWADENGDLGPVYGQQWRSWHASVQDKEDPKLFRHRTVDQLQQAVDTLISNPWCRRNIVSAWNPAVVEDMALPPCHLLYQFSVSQDNRLSCHMYQRSADIFLGVPFNIASYALLTHIMAYMTGLGVGDLIISYGDLHLYSNHVEQAMTQIRREPAFIRPQLGFAAGAPQEGEEPVPKVKSVNDMITQLKANSQREDYDYYNGLGKTRGDLFTLRYDTHHKSIKAPVAV